MPEEQAPPGKKIGRGMLYIAWIGALIALTMVFGSWEKRRYNPNTNAEYAIEGNTRSITLKRNPMGHYVASGVINGIPVVYMLDTGATSVAVPLDLALKLGLKPGPRMPISTANGLVEVRATRIDRLELGPIVLNDVRAVINPGMHDEEILLGMTVLKKLDFQQSGDELTLTQLSAPR